MATPKNPSGPVGYAWLRDRFETPDFLAGREARLASVASLDRQPEGSLLVPRHMDPGESILSHALFALKNEEINLHLLSLALRKVGKDELEGAYAKTPNGAYIRMACYLWERVNNDQLAQASGPPSAPYLRFFDPDLYATGLSRRSSRWRVDFNGLGDVGFCPMVRMTGSIKSLLEEDLLAQARGFAETTESAMLDRALSWAYLIETEGSYAIEGETPAKGKAEAFARLLKHASDPRQLSEEHLCALQNETISNPLNREYEFRSEQNRLQRGRGATGVTYVPPPPDLVGELMDGLIALANEPHERVPALVQAALVSFAFVYIHPFMDGNGRLSRFLVHHCLGQSGQLPKGFVLPISVAMKRHESEYLDALTSFSRPARELCQVMWVAGDDYTYDWKPDADLAFRYMDITECAAFTLWMARESLRHDLQRETQWLADFDHVFSAIDEQYDIRNDYLANLIVFAFDQGGKLSSKRRKQYAEKVRPEILDAIEHRATQCIENRAQSLHPRSEGASRRPKPR